MFDGPTKFYVLAIFGWDIESTNKFADFDYQRLDQLAVSSVTQLDIDLVQIGGRWRFNARPHCSLSSALSRCFNKASFRNSHSQITTTLNPIARNILVFFLSRRTFAANLESQKERLRVGVVVREQCS
jgi:hypothetical protein